jgi:hypothetical protein
MIPTAIVAGLVLGLWIRWWAVPIVAVGWAVVIALVVDPSSALGGALLGAVNGLVGVLPAVVMRRLVDGATPPTRRQPSHPR